VPVRRNLRRDSSQRSVLHLWNWLARFFIGALRWQSLWLLPPTYTVQPDGSGGLRYWLGFQGSIVQREQQCFRYARETR